MKKVIVLIILLSQLTFCWVCGQKKKAKTQAIDTTQEHIFEPFMTEHQAHTLGDDANLDNVLIPFNVFAGQKATHCLVKTIINTKGEVVQVSIQNSNNKEYEQNCIDHIKKTMFVPAYNDGKPVNSYFIYNFTWDPIRDAPLNRSIYKSRPINFYQKDNNYTGIPIIFPEYPLDYNRNLVISNYPSEAKNKCLSGYLDLNLLIDSTGKILKSNILGYSDSLFKTFAQKILNSSFYKPSSIPPKQDYKRLINYFKITHDYRDVFKVFKFSAKFIPIVSWQFNRYNFVYYFLFNKDEVEKELKIKWSDYIKSKSYTPYRRTVPLSIKLTIDESGNVNDYKLEQEKLAGVQDLLFQILQKIIPIMKFKSYFSEPPFPKKGEIIMNFKQDKDIISYDFYQ